MIIYYISLGLRVLRNNVFLTTITIMSLALGIGACITALTVLHVLSSDPVPKKSGQLYYVRIDPTGANGYAKGETVPAPMMTYVDAANIIGANKALASTAVALTPAKITSSLVGLRPLFSEAVTTTSGFFSLFDARFLYGAGWSVKDDSGSSRVVVISKDMNDRLFQGRDSVGQTLRVNNVDLQVVGVLEDWSPQPRFYAVSLSRRNYGGGDGIFMPLSVSLDTKMTPENVSCYGNADISQLRAAPCMFLGVWTQLDNERAVESYKIYLSNYVHEQIASGRFVRNTFGVSSLHDWMKENRVIPDDVRVQVWIAIGFLVICVVNAIGLLLAKNLRRMSEYAVRRALGASRGELFTQIVAEGAIVGLAGGMLGLFFAEAGLYAVRHEPAQYASLATLDLSMFLATFCVSLLAGLLASILPALRACVAAPAPYLKAS
ncbi:ABC transporter permease [Dyella caseinilytica]|uniref:ABC transporter permease n=2 Tax=Dyella caseinilytica TaxID=1849581 RepID=A0ABX7H2I1_9GAMM|nr:ABC transporter permease [Dyella caseinilytica]